MTTKSPIIDLMGEKPTFHESHLKIMTIIMIRANLKIMFGVINVPCFSWSSHLCKINKIYMHISYDFCDQKICFVRFLFCHYIVYFILNCCICEYNVNYFSKQKSIRKNTFMLNFGLLRKSSKEDKKKSCYQNRNTHRPTESDHLSELKFIECYTLKKKTQIYLKNLG